jgi:hypothetical protein
MTSFTTIAVKPDTKKRLNEHKVIPRESIDSLLNRLMDIIEKGQSSPVD